MSYSSITSEQIAAGEPTTQPLFQKIKDDLDDHEARLTAAESGLTSRPPICLDVFGELNPPFAVDELLSELIDTALTLTYVRLLVITAGLSGTLSIDIEYKRGAGSWASILTAPITAAAASGDHFLVTGSLAVTSLLAGDMLRLKVNSVQVNMVNFLTRLGNMAA